MRLIVELPRAVLLRQGWMAGLVILVLGWRLSLPGVALLAPVVPVLGLALAPNALALSRWASRGIMGAFVLTGLGAIAAVLDGAGEGWVLLHLAVGGAAALLGQTVIGRVGFWRRTVTTGIASLAPAPEVRGAYLLLANLFMALALVAVVWSPMVFFWTALVLAPTYVLGLALLAVWGSVVPQRH